MAELGGGGGAEVGTWPCGDLTPQEKDLEDLMGDLVEDMDAGAAGGLHQPIGPWNPCNFGIFTALSICRILRISGILGTL